MDGETEDRGGSVTYPGSHGWSWQNRTLSLPNALLLPTSPALPARLRSPTGAPVQPRLPGEASASCSPGGQLLGPPLRGNQELSGSQSCIPQEGADADFWQL